MTNLMERDRDVMDSGGEVEAIRDRYDRRKKGSRDSLYSPLNPCNYMWGQEKERALIRWIGKAHLEPLCSKTLLEIGCGSGNNLLQMIRLGFMPENMTGNELLDERVREARRILPAEIRIVAGDACNMEVPDESIDVVYQSTVFSSILDDKFQNRLAAKMWSWVKPGGGVLWYDFIYNNPKNKDVRGVRVGRIKSLFPEADVKVWRLTLAPPISRAVTRIHPSLYDLFNMLTPLRTHVLCWIRKGE